MNKGFTLIEMLVSVAIFGIITAIVVFNYGAFQSSIVVTNTAYEMAMVIREAQSYGLSVRNLGSSSADYAYGVNFNKADEKKFYLFADLDKNGLFDRSSVSECGQPGKECLEEFQIRGDVSIVTPCATTHWIFNCSSNDYVDQLDVLFLRPNPEAILVVNGAYDSNLPGKTIYNDVFILSGANVTKTDAGVIIEGLKSGKRKLIHVNRFGQISVRDQ